jgi:hypothetical protein
MCVRCVYELNVVCTLCVFGTTDSPVSRKISVQKLGRLQNAGVFLRTFSKIGLMISSQTSCEKLPPTTQAVNGTHYNTLYDDKTPSKEYKTRVNYKKHRFLRPPDLVCHRCSVHGHSFAECIRSFRRDSTNCRRSSTGKFPHNLRPTAHTYTMI